jgi:hypothetical protein
MVAGKWTKDFEKTKLVMKRRNLELTKPIKNMPASVFEKTEEHRNWGKNEFIHSFLLIELQIFCC